MASTLRDNPNQPGGNGGGTLRNTPNQPGGSGTLRNQPNGGGTLRNTPNQPTGGTLRNTPNQPGSSGTLRDKPAGGGTLRDNSAGTGTLRDNSAGTGTLRDNTAGTGTLRDKPAGGGTLRDNSAGTGTLRDKPAGGGTLRDNDAQKKTGTLRDKPTGGDGGDQQVKVLKKTIQDAGFSEITLGGVKYKVDGLISASTGEAQVYKLSKGGREYALKLYYSGMAPDNTVIVTLAKNQGTGFLVDILDHGTWDSPQGEKRYYELQPYYTGGELQPGTMGGKSDLLKKTAAAMMMALKVAHDHNILHKDIKPGNFFYTDPSRQQLVLADFGIASAFRRDSKGRMLPLKSYVQWRTKIYAAPEIYTSIDGEIQYDNEKSDYYSLGMAILTLWGGEKTFEDIDERTLLRMKRGEGSSLPIPQDMPEQIRHLVMGLTVPNSEKRWGFDEFERWLRGENVPIEGAPQLQTTGAAQFSFVWSGSKSQTAHSPEELGSLMVADRKLAAQYLYSGKISQALGDYPELQVQIDEFINKVYPKNQEAGVMATAYLLNGDLPFYAPTGKELKTQDEIARDMVDNAPKYLDSVIDPNSLLYVWFRAAGIDLADRFVPVAKSKNRLTAVWRIIFTLNPAMPFPMLNVNNDCYSLQNTVEDLLNFFGTQPEHCYDNAKSAYPELLYDDAFIMWLAHRNAALAGKVKSKIAQEKNSKKQLYYYIMYLLGPDRNLFMAKNRNEAFTIDQIASWLNADLMAYYVLGRAENNYKKYEPNLERVRELINLKDNRLYYYLKSKDLYKDKFDYIAYCYDLDSKDNKRKEGPYNVEIATFKALKALNNGEVYYYFPRSQKAVFNLSELDSIPAAEKRDELENGLLKWWLAVQYQEDPYADLSQQYAYERLLSDYTMALGEIDPNNKEAKRIEKAVTTVEKNARKCRSLVRGVKIGRALWVLIVALPLLLIALFSFWPGFAEFDIGLAHKGVLYFVGGSIVNIRILLSIPYIKRFIMYMWGNRTGNYFANHRWICALTYSCAFIGLPIVLQMYGTKFGWAILPAFCLLELWLLYDYAIKDMPLYAKSYDDCLHPDDEALAVEPVYYAWKDTNKTKYESETIDRQELYIRTTKSEFKRLLGRTLYALVPVFLTFCVYALASGAKEDWPVATWVHKLLDIKDDNGGAVIATTTYYANVQTSLNVREKPNANSAVLGRFGRGDAIDVISIDHGLGFAKILYNGKEAYVNANYISETPIVSSKGKSQPAAQQQQQQQRQADPEPTIVTPAMTGLYMPKSNYTYINLYNSQTTGADAIICEIRNGEVFEVLDTPSSRFALVNFNGRTGFVDRNLIEKAN